MTCYRLGSAQEPGFAPGNPVRPAILTPFAGASRLSRPSLNGGARAGRDQIQALTTLSPWSVYSAGMLAAVRRCLTKVQTKKKAPTGDWEAGANQKAEALFT